jgi:hypothetical protein
MDAQNAAMGIGSRAARFRKGVSITILICKTMIGIDCPAGEIEPVAGG